MHGLLVAFARWVPRWGETKADGGVEDIRSLPRTNEGPKSKFEAHFVDLRAIPVDMPFLRPMLPLPTQTPEAGRLRKAEATVCFFEDRKSQILHSIAGRIT